MKIMNVLITALLVLAVLVVTVHAAVTGSNPEGTPFGEGGIPQTPESPVQGITPTTVYNQYFYTWNHGGGSIVAMPNPAVFVTTNDPGSISLVLNKAPSGSFTVAYVLCPLQAIASYTGKHPLIRYGAFEFMTSSSSIRIESLHFYNGHTPVKSLPVSGWFSSPVYDWEVMTFDMGAYYDFPRGYEAILAVRNYDTASSKTLRLGGYGAKSEWNQ